MINNIQRSAVMSIKLQKDSTINIHENNNKFIGDFWNMAVSLHPFRMYIPDTRYHRVEIINKKGNIISIFGREGKGPGEFNHLKKIIVNGDRLVIQTNYTFEVFDTTGHFINRFYLPKKYSEEDLWSLSKYHSSYYVAGIDVNLLKQGLKATKNQTCLIALDSAFQVTHTFGSFPSFYKDNAFIWRFRSMDISSNGILAVGFYLLPDIYLYNLRNRKPVFMKKLMMSDSHFHFAREAIPIHLTMEELRKRAAKLSFIWHTYMINDSTIVQTFNNRSLNYYRDMDEQYMRFYVMFKTISGYSSGHATLPGPIVGEDAKGRLYIRESNAPNRRVIGIYHLEWAKNDKLPK